MVARARTPMKNEERSKLETEDAGTVDIVLSFFHYCPGPKQFYCTDDGIEDDGESGVFN